MGLIRKALTKLRDQYRFSDTDLSSKEKFLLALPGPAAMLSNVIVHNVYIKLFTDVVKLDPVYVGMMYFWFNIWNTSNDPIIGILIDRMRYNPKRGKFMYLMRVTVPFIIISLMAMLFVNPAWPQKRIFFILLAELFIFDTAYTTFRISNHCYFLLAAPSKDERVDVNVLVGYVSNFFSFFATVVPSFLLVGSAMRARLEIVAILMGVVTLNAVIYVIAISLLKDKPEMYAGESQEKESLELKTIWKDVKSILSMKAFRTWFVFNITGFAPSGIYFTTFLYFMDHVIRAGGLHTTIADVVPMLVVFIVYPMIGNAVKRIGSKKAIFSGMVPYIIGYIMLLFTATWWQVLIAYIPIMFGKYLAETAMVPLNAAIIDENEMFTGSRKTALFGAVNSFLMAPIAGIHLVIFMAIIKYFGYDEHAALQSARVMTGIRIATAVVPIVYCLVGMIPLAMFPYDKKKEEELSKFSEEQRRGKDIKN